ncbi:MFS transporter [Caballeronia sp. EK]|uniref:MFS transporter n=1 Tax=Caballeronia sp. EK TaxID=2767469 RepID=UPI001655C819|nr:MFS transporter [Caballeronia sp. EK]MBC8641362.1 MFS transporter [Caballeronia sp. EK]
MMTNVNAGARLDRLSIGPFHRRVLWLVGMGMFFDSFDNTLSGSVLAAMLHDGWSTLQLNSYFMSATFLGLTIGAALSGWLSDRFGRLFAYQFNLAIFGVMALVSAFAPSMYWLIGIRFVMGIGMGAEYVMGYGMVIEFVPPEKRGRYLGLLGVITGAGVFVTSVVGLVAIPHLGWRSMFVIGGVGTLWLWYLRRHLPESPRWLESVGRGEEADAILRRIEEEACVTAPIAPVTPVAATPAKPRVNVSVLFTRPVIRRTLVALVVNVIVLFGSYTITGWMPTFFVSQGMSVTHSLGFNAAMMGGYVAGPFLCAFIADRLGRRWGVALAAVYCAALCAVYPFLTSPVSITLCGFFLVGGVAVALILGLGGTPELFPTEYRFRGAGFAQTAGRIGLIGGPFVILDVFKHYGIGGVIGAVSGLYILVALVLAVAGIETNKKSLEAVEPDASPENDLIDAAKVQSNI